MKSLFPILALFLILSVGTLQAQQQYTVDGQTYTLNTEVEGTLTLLWNTIDGEYRYFSKKGSDIVELKNTKQNGDYQEEYKKTLEQQTADAVVSTEKVNLTLPSLRSFFVEYNKKKDPNFSNVEESIDLQFRLGAFVGITNSVYTLNPTNELQPIAGVDLELIDNVKLRRHSIVFRFKQIFESSEYKYSASQLSLNYRFKFVKTPKFDAFINTKFASLTFSSREYTVIPLGGSAIVNKESGSDFNAPVTFGLGADYKVGNGYITFNYNDIVGLNVESNDEFPVDFTLGYKFNL
ncbi:MULTISPECIES: hypothetical protein [Aequorivita]|uniref:Outer membrane protein beta-barrel domain-containing protein n=1 Tax=Aequorivita iocasae TaxID=2803865 RepID=A0ABX7DUQ7_9FLAO|nr:MULTISPECIES: hypothetical protein [Aequorivita]QQX77282.1 hypothetical protein JK629_03150 [Aequorivita iocasae]UCA56771.1 hypothetical protein LDL78_03170 [Aequorivita sp. F7]